MRNKLLPLLLIILILLAAAITDENKYLRLEAKVPLPNVKGRIDHLAVVLKNNRLFVAALGNNSLEVIDLVSGKQTAAVTNLQEPQGVLFTPETNQVVVSNGEDGTVRFYDSRSLKLAGAVDCNDDADNLRYDAETKRIYVGYGEGAIGVIDAQKFQKIADIKLEGHPESFQLEINGNRIFVNVPSAHQITVIEKDKYKVVATWPLMDFSDNYPMALDEKHHRLFVGCRRPARLIVVDTDTGKIVKSLECAGDADDIFYDDQTGLIYVTGGEGFISIFKQIDANKYNAVDKIATARGARTSLFVPESGRLYIAAGQRDGQEAQILVFETKVKNINSNATSR